MASYRVEIEPECHLEIRQLPGNFRQRIVRAIKELESEPRPYTSSSLEMERAGFTVDSAVELRRIRMTPWRIVYVVEEKWERVVVLAVRKRPPYQYDDLSALLRNL